MAIDEQITKKLRALELDYFSKTEAAALIKRDTRTLDRWYASGEGPLVTLISGRHFYDKKQFLRWLVAREEKPARNAAKKARR